MNVLMYYCLFGENFNVKEDIFFVNLYLNFLLYIFKYLSNLCDSVVMFLVFIKLYINCSAFRRMVMFAFFT